MADSVMGLTLVKKKNSNPNVKLMHGMAQLIPLSYLSSHSPPPPVPRELSGALGKISRYTQTCLSFFNISQNVYHGI